MVAPKEQTPQPALHVLAVSGSMNSESVTRVVVGEAARQLIALGCEVDMLDLRLEGLPMYNPETSHQTPHFQPLQQRVDNADVVLLGSPDYHGSISSATKNFLDHFWREFGGKLFATVVVSHEKGLTVTDQLRTVARQCYAWALPYGVSVMAEEDVKEGEITSETLQQRLEMMSRDIAVYGRLLAAQRRADLASKEPGFMARLR
jgi:FMN reductase